jgi:hypothetical protein
MLQRFTKTINISNSLQDPPFWQHLFTFLPTKAYAKFAIWDSIWDMMVFLILYFLNIVSTLTPNDWPLRKNESLISTAIMFDFYVIIPVIIINLCCAMAKIFLATRKNDIFYNGTLSNRSFKVFKWALSFLLPCTTCTFWIIYLFFSNSNLAYQKLIIHIPAVIIIIIVLTIRLYNAPIYKINTFGLTILEKFCCLYSNQKKEQILSGATFYFYLLSSYIFNICWYTTCIMIGFNVGAITTQFAWSTISNFLINSDSIKTYGYAISLVATFYKFYNDIQLPFRTLRDFIFQERQNLSKKEIEENNERVNGLNEAEAMKNCYYIPMSWDAFSKLAQMCHIWTITNMVLLQGFITLFCIFLLYMAAQVFGSNFFSSKNSNLLFGIITGSMYSWLF